VSSEGTYSKGRDRITERVTRVASERLAGDPDAPVPRTRESSGGLVFVRTAGWIIAILLGVVILGVAFVGTSVFLREHQDEQLRQQLRRTEHDVEVLQSQQQETERRLVEMETKLELLRER